MSNATQTTNLRLCIRKLPVGVPKESDFRVEEVAIPTIKDSEILCHVQYLALDPYVRAFGIASPMMCESG